MTVTIENVDMNDMELDEGDVVPPKPEVLAEEKKELGNQQYKLKQYAKALIYYSEAIDLWPDNPSYYGNRSACYMMQGNYALACGDASRAVVLDPKFVKGWVRVAKSYIAVGDFTNAENALKEIEKLDPINSILFLEKKNLENGKKLSDDAQKAYEKKDFRKVVFLMDRALEICNACSRFKIVKAECLARLGRYQEAQELANDVLSCDKQNADAILVRGMCLYYQDNVERAFTHFQHVLKLAPDHAKALEIYKKAKVLKQKKEEGNGAFKAGKNREAYDLYSEALSIDPNNFSTNAKLYFNRATVSSKLGRLNEAVSDCSLALKLDPNYLKALMRRAKCYMDLQEYEEAVRDYEKLFKIDKSRETRKLLNDAKLELKKSQRKDYYKILGVNKDATTEDIKKAYRKRALVHHPDRHANATDVEKQEQEKKFKEVGEAYTILSDPQKRTRYDNGFDLDDCGSQNASSAFEAFFTEASPFFTNGSCPPSGFTFQFQQGPM